MRGPNLLRRADERRWAAVLGPVLRDSAGIRFDAASNRNIQIIDDRIQLLLDDYAKHTFPRAILHPGPTEVGSLDAAALCSFLVGHRAERLVQCVELSAAALDNLEHGSLQVSAVAARALMEVAAASSAVHSILIKTWREVHGSPVAVQRLANDEANELVLALWSVRLGTRQPHLLELGYPHAINSLTVLGKIAQGDPEFKGELDDLYRTLCEATHPNSEAQGVLWRRGRGGMGGRSWIRFEPSRSESPVKTAIVRAILLSYELIQPYCRDLWWVAAETSIACNLANRVDARALGLPIPGQPADICCCGSGHAASVCDHPEPPLPRQQQEE